MAVTVDGVTTELEGKVRKVGAEAPNIRVAFADGSTGVFGLDSALQIALFLPTLANERHMGALLELDALIGKRKNLKALAITADTQKEAAALADGRFERLRIICDSDGSVASKYGVLIKEGALKGRPANAVAVLDEDGGILHYEVADEVYADIDFLLALESISAYEEKKRSKKGHSHENWMRT